MMFNMFLLGLLGGFGLGVLFMRWLWSDVIKSWNEENAV